jgi:SAM-dependent methyltransferase
MSSAERSLEAAMNGAARGGADTGRFNEALYDRFWGECPDFSRYNPGARHRRRLIAEMLRGVPGERLLDVGCGDGELLMWLRRELPRVTSFAGVDLSSETVKRNRERWPDMEFHALDIARGALRGARGSAPDPTFDIVVCSEVIEHIDDRRAAFQHLAAMVAPGGHLLVTCPAGRVYTTERHFGHVSHPTVHEMDADAARAGLRRVRRVNWGFPLYNALKWATNVNPGWAMKNFASGRYSPAAKLVSSALYWANYLSLPTSDRGCQLFVLFQR